MEPSRDEGPLLLVREREELARVAHRLSVGGPAFVLIVCAPRLREAVRDVLRAHDPLATLEPPTTLDSAEAVLAELTEARALRSIAVGGDAEVMRAVNWHREKVRREGVTLLWLEDVDALERFRELAPDAYSFRDALVIIDGVPEFTIEPPTERPELKLARRRYERAKSSQERVIAGGEYLHELTNSGRWEDALALGRALELPFKRCFERGVLSSRQIALLATQFAAVLGNGRALVELQRFLCWSISRVATSTDAESLVGLSHLKSSDPDPISLRRWESVEHAVRIADGLAYPHRVVVSMILRVKMDVLLARGRTRDALRLCNDVLGRSVSHFERSNALADVAALQLECGERTAALALLRDAWRSGEQSALGPPARRIVRLHLQGSELESAKRMLFAMMAQTDSVEAGSLLPMAVSLARLSGDTERCMEHLAIRVASGPQSTDGSLYSACSDAVDLHTALRDADRLDPDSAAHWDSLLERAQATLLSYGETDPPWYRVLLPYQRARLLALRPERRDDALTLFREAWELGRDRYPEAAPQVAVHLINTLFDAGTLDEIPALLDAAEAVAVTRERLNDQMALCAQRVRYAALTGASPDTFPPLRARLDALFAESGSLVLKGNTLRTLATELPPQTAVPDPLALAEEARALFSEMQMPHEEALCVERIGEVLLARGDRAGARQRFQYALQRRRTYGLGMRIPRLERLLASVTDAR